ncbi:MAG: FAD-binding protein, partial [Chlamydiota bacterium]|nr:FAD-binding protein [Chlamydiota bacterium]
MLERGVIHRDVALAPFSTFRIGGRADYFVVVHNAHQLRALLSFLQEEGLPYWILGKGSNILFPDEGLRGCVIHLSMDEIRYEKGGVWVGAGYSFAALAVGSAKRGWGGLEWGAGIPGSVGGAIFMNAGAEGETTWGTLHRIAWMDEEGREEVMDAERLRHEAGYRRSPFQKGRKIILDAYFTLAEDRGAYRRQKEMLA